MKLGAKAHTRDIEQMKPLRPAVVEVHTDASDIINPDALLVAFREWGNKTLLHAPLYLDRPGKMQIVDIASADQTVRSESISLLAETCRVAAELDARYVIIHPGGVLPDNCRAVMARSRHCFDEEMLLSELSMNLQISLVELSTEVEDFYPPDRILMENMPYHFWMKDGEKRYSQLLVEADDFEAVLPYCGGICLDVCHGYLAREEGTYDVMERLLEMHGRQVKHVHISDARAPDGEGLQIGTGDISFGRVVRLLRQYTDYDALTGIPEIKDGHLNRGRGFRTALDRLRALF